jgi:ABC-type uncharacterized transport system permease subunit
MENESSKNKRGRVLIGVIMGFAVGVVVGFIGGIRTSSLEVLWIIIGLACIIIIGIGVFRIFRSGKKKG